MSNERLCTETVMRRVITTEGIGRVSVVEPAGQPDVVRLVLQTADGQALELNGLGAAWLRNLANDLLDAAERVVR